jgi:pimeloyl-ACP methyl ester carboxylesterase
VTANGVRHHVQRLGSHAQDARARSVVFLHGLVMDNLSSWYFTVASRLARSEDVILYDLRGHGRSERPSSGYRTTDLVADLDALLDALQVDRRVALVGNSFGGLLAIAYAAAHPERVERLALVDAHVSAGSWAEEMTATLELRGEERDRMIAESFKSWLGRHSDRKRNRLARAAEALVYGTTLVSDLRASPALRDLDLAAIDCPVLALYGAGSDALDRGQHLARTLPRCELRVLPECTHSVLWEETAEVREQLVGWLSRPDIEQSREVASG